MLPLHILKELAEKNPAPPIHDKEEESKVFKHVGLFSLPSREQVRDEEPGDWERYAHRSLPHNHQNEASHYRLAFLGDQVLSMCATDVLFERYPFARSSFLTVSLLRHFLFSSTHAPMNVLLQIKRTMLVSNDQVAAWSQAYEFPQRIEAQPSQKLTISSNLISQASVFEAYVGAVYKSEGPQRVETWLRPLITRVLDEVDEKEKREQEEEQEERDAHGYVYDEGDNTGTRGPLFVYGPHVHRTTMTLEEEEEDIDDYYPSNSFLSTPLSRQSLLGSTTPRAALRGRVPAGIIPERVTNTLKFRPEGEPSTAPSTPSTHGVVHTSSPSHYSSSPRSTASRLSTNTLPPTSPTTGNGYLALFNQLAAQRHVAPIWSTEMSGPAHKPTFEATVMGTSSTFLSTSALTPCLVGNKSGTGVALNKQAAKQIAARDALKVLKWHLE